MLTTSERERLRRSYRPERVHLLFVGESPPAGGRFFYLGNSVLYASTKEAFERVYGPRVGEDCSSFLRFFRDCGCYLEDLSLEPINHLPDSQRKEKREAAVPLLAKRIAEIQPPPEKIVAIMKEVDCHVRRAVLSAGLSEVPFEVLPFPTPWSKARYVNGLVNILSSY